MKTEFAADDIHEAKDRIMAKLGQEMHDRFSKKKAFKPDEVELAATGAAQAANPSINADVDKQELPDGEEEAAPARV